MTSRRVAMFFMLLWTLAEGRGLVLYHARRGSQVEHNTAFLFPGQGSQYAGMGRDVAEKYPAARHVFDEIDSALGFPLSKVCFEGPEDQLKLTAITQPAILAVSSAIHEVLEDHGA